MSDLSNYFALDPRHHTRESIDTIIAAFRKARASFNLDAKQAGNPKKMNKAVEGAPQLNLDELGFE